MKYSKSNDSIESFAFITNDRQKIQLNSLKNELMKVNNINNMHREYFDGTMPTMSRWESTWDGIHYSLLVTDEQLSNGLCYGSHVKGGGGHEMCKNIKEYKGINKCIFDKFTNGYNMHWCRNIVTRELKYNRFEGGVSRMLLIIWLNSMCNY